MVFLFHFSCIDGSQPGGLCVCSQPRGLCVCVCVCTDSSQPGGLCVMFIPHRLLCAVWVLACACVCLSCIRRPACAAGGGRKRVQAYCMWVTRARVLHVRDLRSCASWQCMRGGNGSAARCPQPEARAIQQCCQLLMCGPKKLINRVNPLEARAIPQRAGPCQRRR